MLFEIENHALRQNAPAGGGVNLIDDCCADDTELTRQLPWGTQCVVSGRHVGLVVLSVGLGAAVCWAVGVAVAGASGLVSFDVEHLL